MFSLTQCQRPYMTLNKPFELNDSVLIHGQSIRQNGVHLVYTAFAPVTDLTKMACREITYIVQHGTAHYLEQLQARIGSIPKTITYITGNYYGYLHEVQVQSRRQGFLQFIKDLWVL